MNTVLPNFKNITELNEHLTPFPNSDDIFVESQSWLKEHFLPLISIDLGMLKDEWQGQMVHLLNPFEPIDGYIGESTHDFHNEFTGENWFAFKLTDENRYEFLGSQSYFEIENLDDYDDFQEKLDNYNKQKAFFKENGFIADCHYPKYENNWNKKSLLDGLGGGFWYGNWTDSADVPSAFVKTRLKDIDDDTPNDGIEITYQDNPFYYIGDVAGYNYCGGYGEGTIMLMYEPISRIVLFTFDYS